MKKDQIVEWTKVTFQILKFTEKRSNASDIFAPPHVKCEKGGKML